MSGLFNLLDGRIVLHGGDNRDVLKTVADNSIDSVVTDPPYALKFMGKSWDTGEIAHDVEFWREIFRVLKPGGHLLAFGGTRTHHRMVCAIEDAGFEVRDMIAWLYGTGFPKSLDVSKAIDKAAGAEREVVGEGRAGIRALGAQRRLDTGYRPQLQDNSDFPLTAPATDAAREWDGWGTALKPALEPICLARKPLGEGTVAANVLMHGTGGINIDGCRVGTDEAERAMMRARSGGEMGGEISNDIYGTGYKRQPAGHDHGRFPANIIHDGSDEVLAAFPTLRGPGNRGGTIRTSMGYHGGAKGDAMPAAHDAGGSTSRFFYSAKANKQDRAGSKHPTVKPIALMRYLCRLITPPGGTVLDPFAGSGTTGAAALAEGFACILIEREAEYLADIKSRFASMVEAAQ